MVGEVGLEPTKSKTADLQSAPFAARDIPPNRRIELEPNANEPGGLPGPLSGGLYARHTWACQPQKRQCPGSQIRNILGSPGRPCEMKRRCQLNDSRVLF